MYKYFIKCIIINIYIKKDVPPPNVNIPTDEEFWSKEDPTKPNIDFLKDHFIHEGRIKEEHALAIIEKATEIFKQEETLLEVDAPITGKYKHIKLLICQFKVFFFLFFSFFNYNNIKIL